MFTMFNMFTSILFLPNFISYHLRTTYRINVLADTAVRPLNGIHLFDAWRIQPELDDAQTQTSRPKIDDI